MWSSVIIWHKLVSLKSLFALRMHWNCTDQPDNNNKQDTKCVYLGLIWWKCIEQQIFDTNKCMQWLRSAINKCILKKLWLKNIFTFYETLLITVQGTQTLRKFGNNVRPEVEVIIVTLCCCGTVCQKKKTFPQVVYFPFLYLHKKLDKIYILWINIRLVCNIHHKHINN